MKSLLQRMFKKHSPQKPVLVVCAAQRSGTNVLEETLAQGPTFEKYGEVFLGPTEIRGRKAQRLNYFSFRSQAFRSDPDLSIPTRENQRSLLQSYLNLLAEDTAKQAVIIDVKYNSWHHMNDVWHWEGQRPHLADLIQDWQFPVLHLIRRNGFERSCSELIARQTKRYHVRRNADKPGGVKIEIDPKLLERKIGLVNEQVENFQRYFQGYDRYLEIHYEDLFEGDRLNATIGEQVASLCRFPIEFDQSLTQRKAVPRLRDFVSNFEELQQHFAGTEIERQLKAA